MTFPMAVLLASQMAANQIPPAQPVQAADSAHSEAVTLATPMGEVYGTLLLPSAPGPVPVVLLIAGSGPTDRDGNSPLLPGGGPASLRLLAEALADHGIASLRYDKRGIGASKMTPEHLKTLRFDSYVDDAEAWAKRLQGDSRFSRVVIAGHSEGALIGTLAAQRLHGVALVSIYGAGKRA
jgi:pimeloyl-ACP methyl ester carboxylesterase